MLQRCCGLQIVSSRCKKTCDTPTSPVCSVKTETVFLSCCDDVSSSLTCLFLTSSLRYVTPESQRGSGGKAASSPAENYHLARRRTLQVVVSALLTECGFESAEKAAVETLTEMMQSCTYEPRVHARRVTSLTALPRCFRVQTTMFCLFFFFFPDISEIGRCAKAYCEHTARSVPTLSDAVVTLIEMGKYCGLHTAYTE